MESMIRQPSSCSVTLDSAQLALRAPSNRSSILATRRAMRARLTTEGECVNPSSLLEADRAGNEEVNAEKITFKPKTFFTRGSRQSNSWSYGSPAS